MTRQYVSYSKLSFFLSKLRTIFSDINHTHTVADIDNLQDTLDIMQNNTNALEQTVDNLVERIDNNKLPTVTADNNGAFLRVVDGAWSIDTIPIAEEAEF